MNKILLLKVETDSDIIPFEFHGDNIPIRKGDLIFWDTKFSTDGKVTSTYHTKGIVASVCVIDQISGNWETLYGRAGKIVTLKRAYRPIYTTDDEIDEDF